MSVAIEAVQRLFLPTEARTSGYHEAFATSGENKAKEILIALQKADVFLGNAIYVSIGGSTGTEAVHILENADLPDAVTVEFCNEVRTDLEQNVQRLARLGKRFEYLIGDATQLLPALKKRLRLAQTRDSRDTLVLSLQAVVHELPYLSPGFELTSFLTSIAEGFANIACFIREPCDPIDWPAEVIVSCSGSPPEALQELACLVADRLRFSQRPTRAGAGIRAIRPLAVETIFKRFYIEDLHHEIEERLTHFTCSELLRKVEIAMGSGHLFAQHFASNSFVRHYRRLEVKAFDALSGDPLPAPNPFVKLEYFRKNAVRPARPINKRKIYRVVDFAEAIELGFTVKGIVAETIELDYRTIPGLEEKHEGSHERWEPFVRENPHTLAVLLDERNTIVGYWHYIILGEEDYRTAVAGCLNDSEICSLACPPLFVPGWHDIYFMIVSIDPKHRTEATRKQLLTAFLS